MHFSVESRQSCLCVERELGVETQHWRREDLNRHCHSLVFLHSFLTNFRLFLLGARRFFNGGHETIELLLRTVISANQLSIYGAIADLCDEVPKRVRAPGKLAAAQHLEKVDIHTVLSKAENSTNGQQWRNLRQEYERKFEQLSGDQKLSKLCSDAGLKLVEREQYFHTLEQKKDNRCNTYAENTRCLAMKRDSYRRMGSQEYEDRPSIEHKRFAIMMFDTVSKFKFHLCFKTIPFLGSES